MINWATRYSFPPDAGRPVLRHRSNIPSLPLTIQEHLGQLLRAEYYERGDKPRFVGDPALPLAFESYLQRLDQKERDSRSSMVAYQGSQAVAAALLGMHA